MKRINIHNLKDLYDTITVPFYRLFFAFLLVLLSLPAVAGASSMDGVEGKKVQLITLDQALKMARESGPTLERTELELDLVQSSLDAAKRQYNIGSYYDSRTMKDDIDDLEEHIDIKLDRIKELDTQIEEWREEKDELEAAGETAAASRLESEINQASQEKAVLDQELLEIRKAQANLIPRYYQMKSVEDAARPVLDPLKLARDAAADAVVIQPDVLDYRVESRYLTLLAMDRQLAYQQLNLKNWQQMVVREKLRVELGMSTAQQLAQVETAVEQVAAAIEQLRAQQKNLKRDFAINELGLPLDSEFALAPVDPGRLFVGEQSIQNLLDVPPPDLTQSLYYRRALDTLQMHERNLDDTAKGDTHKYREAELKVKEAKLDLEQTLNLLQAYYQGARENLEVSEQELHNAALLLRNEETNFARAELEYSLGIVSRMVLEEKELALREAENKWQQAETDHYLAYRKYLLAREGILLQ